MANIIMKYKDLLSQTDSETAAEKLNTQVEQAEICFKQGLLDVESKLLTAKSKLSSAELAIKQAQTNLTNAKRSNPENLVQNLINALLATTQAEIDFKAQQDAYNKIVDLQVELLAIQKELF